MEKILVSPEELSRHLDDPQWVVFDTRHDMGDVEKGRRAYAAGHIPGAYFLHVDEDLSGAKTGRNGRHPLPDLATFAAKMNARGVTPQAQVVVYDDLAGNFAVRLWWMLRWLGHDRVALLDGGWPQWVKEGRAVDKAIPAPRTGSFVARPHLGSAVDAAYVDIARRDATVALIDARAAPRFRGEQEPLDAKAGHIPGAVNRFWQSNMDGDGRFKPASLLRSEFAALLGDRAALRTVHYCGSGVTACHNLFAMELAGLSGSRLYPGSWSEWSADASRPVATGDK
jgi:thiosulfate/3-mercaptopyruvate sulfurtransferase